MAQNRPDSLEGYACPRCKGPLTLGSGALECSACHAFYPIVGSILDFLAKELAQSTHSVLRGVGTEGIPGSSRL
jgi:uncharacterized protein YbaR (Trm112 family)